MNMLIRFFFATAAFDIASALQVGAIAPAGQVNVFATADFGIEQAEQWLGHQHRNYNEVFNTRQYLDVIALATRETRQLADQMQRVRAADQNPSTPIESTLHGCQIQEFKSHLLGTEVHDKVPATLPKQHPLFRYVGHNIESIKVHMPVSNKGENLYDNKSFAKALADSVDMGHECTVHLQPPSIPTAFRCSGTKGG